MSINHKIYENNYSIAFFFFIAVLDFLSLGRQSKTSQLFLCHDKSTNLAVIYFLHDAITDEEVGGIDQTL
jgi:hypothetical protein